MTKITVEIENISIEHAPAIYKAGGLQPYFEHIKSQVAGEVPDLSTVEGRKRIASLAAQVSRSKTAVDKVGRDYLRELKALPKTIEAELKQFVTNCDILRDSVRQPLTDFEAKEKERLQRHESRINRYQARAELLVNNPFATSDEAQALIDDLYSHQLTEEVCEEFLSNYTEARESAVVILKKFYTQRKEFEAQQAELIELRKLAVAQAEEQRKQQAIQSALEEQRNKESAQIAELRVAAEREKQARIDAEKAAEQAAEMERLRLKEQAAAEQAAAEKAALNRAHRTKVNRDILTALVEAGIDQDVAKNVIKLAASGKAGKLTVNY